MGPHSTYDDLGPGLHILRAADPLKRAGVMAANLRAELCATLLQADAVVAERSARPRLDAPTLVTMQGLARRVARAHRISARTRERAVVEVGHHLMVHEGGLAVHPTTIRERAGAVEIARADLAAAEGALTEHATELDLAEVRAKEEAAAAEAAARKDALRREEERRERLRWFRKARRSRAIGLIVAAFGLGLVMLGLSVPLWAALLPALAVSLWATRYLQPHIEPSDDEGNADQEASELLSMVSTTTDEVFSGRWLHEQLDEQSSLLEARRDRVLEQVRVAERGWKELAGEGVDVSALEDVVRRFDPQHEDAPLLAGETVGVRTAEVVLHHFQQRWIAFWRELGLEAPTPEVGEEAVRELAAQVSRPIVLVGAATARGADLSRVAPTAAVVIVEGAADGPALLS